jgi:hypothetical protein
VLERPALAGISGSAERRVTKISSEIVHPPVALLASSYQNGASSARYRDGEDAMFDAFVAQLGPIFGIFMIIAIVIGPMWIRSYFNARDRAQMHETLRVAYEKGQPVPPELIEKLTASTSRESYSTPSSNAPDADLRRAVVLIAVGLGLAGLGFGFWYALGYASDTASHIVGGIIAGSGAIPGFIGLAYLSLWALRRNAPKA